MRFFFVCLLSIVLVAGICRGQVKKTTRSGLVFHRQFELLEKVSSDTAVASAYSDSIRIYGYEKKFSDAYEHFYVANKTPFHLSRLMLRFTYKMPSGELLHDETYDVVCDIPSGATRHLSIRSFDRRHALFYHKSPRPKRSGTPFTLAYRILRYDVAVELPE